ncbi:hypothetical protein [Kribbella sp. CA-293567]|uniref:hypothetical protein n=1 Tax=Kribbella sp. CA-293567 TaxID=3002436 RepID=UPI0022DE386D|nr:hypothetical protein [Kribbella sp. CA-293567]WBQ04982.1 hypothetical protein OX958_34145 [Kribbella sp. CA-293567]
MLDWLRKRLFGARGRPAGSTPVETRDEPGQRAWLLAKQGYLDDAAAVLRASDKPQHEAMLALLLREYGRLDDAIEVLQASTDPDAALKLEQFRRERGAQLAQLTLLTELDGSPPERSHEVDALLEDGHIEESIDLLKGSRLLADRTRLQALLRELGRTDELREIANHSIRLATLRAEGRVDELRALAEAGDREAGALLADALAEAKAKEPEVYDPFAGEKTFDQLIRQGLADEAAAELAEWPETRANDDARLRLVKLYVEQDRAEDAIAVLRAHRSLAPELLADLLVETGQVAEAIAVLDASEQRGAARDAARLRAEHGYVDELRARAEAGERLSAEQLALWLAAQGELDELRVRAAAGDHTFEAQLIRALGKLGQLDELATLATTAYPARWMWWATLLAETDSSAVAATLDEYAVNADWYAGETATGAVINLLVEKRRIGTAIAFAEARVSAGDDWAVQWVPRPPQTRFPSEQVATWQLLASKVIEALPELLPTGTTTVSIADADYALYADLRVTQQAPDRAKIALACWTVQTDAARYFGDHPPEDAERQLDPAGTAVPELNLTVGVIDDLAGRLKSRDLPQPHPGGRHLTISIGLPLP